MHAFLLNVRGLVTFEVTPKVRHKTVGVHFIEQQNHIAETLLKIEQKALLYRQINHNLPTPDRSSEAEGVRRAA